MNAPNAPPTLDERKQRRAAARFHLRVGQAGTAAKVYDEYSRPLFPFWVYMEVEGLLAPAPGAADGAEREGR